MQLLGDLAAGIGAADHQHRPGRQGTGIPVVAGVQLRDFRGQGATEGRRLGELKRARGDDDGGRRVGGAVRGGHAVALAVPRRIDGRDLHPAAHRGLEAGRVLLQVAHHVRTGHEPVRIAPLIREARQPDRPVGGHEREGVPPPVPPGRRDLRGLFQHHVRTALLGQIVADGQPGLSAANDHSLDLLRHVCVLLWQMPLHAPIPPAAQSYVKQHLPVTGVDERPNEWPNAARQLLPKAGARHERTLEAVSCTRWLGVIRCAVLIERGCEMLPCLDGHARKLKIGDVHNSQDLLPQQDTEIATP